MTKADVLGWYNSIDHTHIPNYIDVDDANWSQVCINGKWQNVPFSWSLFFDGIVWKYVETDGERGYVWELREFDTESEAAAYANRILDMKYRAVIGEKKRLGNV